MKKLLLSAGLIIPALWAGITWFTSSQTEDMFDKTLTESNQKLTESFPFIKMEKQSFEKGFINSTAKSVITFDKNLFDDENKPTSLTMNHTIYHGPVMMTPNGIKTGASYVFTTLDQESMPDKSKDLVRLLFDGAEPFASGVHAGANGSINIDLEIAPISFDNRKYNELTGKSVDPDRLDALSFAGVTGHLATNTEGTTLKGTLSMGAVKLKGDSSSIVDIAMAASAIEIEINEIYKGSMLDGSIEITIPEFTLSEGEANDITVNGLTTVIKAYGEDGSYGGLVSLDIEKIVARKDNPPFNLPESKFHLTYGAKGFDREDIINLIDLDNEMRSTQLALMGNSGARQKSLIAMTASTGAYILALGEAIKPGVASNVAITVSNKNGNSAANLDLNYAASKNLLDLKTIMELVVALQGQLKISIDKGMIAGTPAEEAIGMPLAMNFAVDKGETYETIANLAEGKLKVNGETVPVLEMLGGMIYQPIPWGELIE